MGACCSSSSGDKYETGRGTEGAKPSSASKPSPASGGAAKGQKGQPHDFGLSATHEVIMNIGRGGEGETWLCKEKPSGNVVAIKLIKRPIPKPAIPVIKREIKIQADLGQGHLNIVSASEVIMSHSHLGLVMEYVSGGNMVNYVTKKRETKHERGGLCLDEEEARFYFVQLVSAVEYCHKHHVAHRDLKLDNTLLDDHVPPRLKLCDFGFAKHWQTNSNMTTLRIGTPEYMGPELINGAGRGYDGKKVDVWAAGVLLYVMLAGMFPFETQDNNFHHTEGLYDIFLQQIKTSWRDAPNNSMAVSKLSPELKDFLDKVFEVRQDHRLDITGIKAHPWFNKPLPEKYAAALRELQAEQDKLSQQVPTATVHNPERDRQLEAMLNKAITVGLPTDEVQRLSLLSTDRPDLKAHPPAISTLKEEE